MNIATKYDIGDKLWHISRTTIGFDRVPDSLSLIVVDGIYPRVNESGNIKISYSYSILQHAWLGSVSKLEDIEMEDYRLHSSGVQYFSEGSADFFDKKEDALKCLSPEIKILRIGVLTARQRKLKLDIEQLNKTLVDAPAELKQANARLKEIEALLAEIERENMK
ncbi:MAG: hypothetical protein LIR46_01715 [Bacteroidota bacterium]|nr:hypothetical protein [Bacteroidota bacterium]